MQIYIAMNVKTVEGPNRCKTHVATIKTLDNGDYVVKFDTAEGQEYKEMPSRKDPGILVKVGIKAEVLEIRYPKRFTREQVEALVRERLRETKDCPMCKRAEFEILGKPKKHGKWSEWGIEAE